MYRVLKLKKWGGRLSYVYPPLNPPWPTSSIVNRSLPIECIPAGLSVFASFPISEEKRGHCRGNLSKAVATCGIVYSIINVLFRFQVGHLNGPMVARMVEVMH